MGGGAGQRSKQDSGGLPLSDQSLALLHAVLAQAPFGFAVLDTQLRYLHVNDVLARLNGRPADQHRGLRPADIAPELEDLVGPALREVLATKAPVSNLEFEGVSPVTQQRQHFIFNAYPVPSRDGGLLGVAAAVVDVTDQRTSHDRLRDVARQQAAVVELGLEALRGASVQTLITTALRALREVLGMDQSAVVRAEQQNQVFGLYAVDPPGATESPGSVTPGDRTQAGQTLATGGPTVMEDRAEETRFDRIIGGVGIDVRSSIVAVVPGVDGPFGVVGVYHSQPRKISEDDVRFVQAVAAVIGTAVERRRTERELEASNSRLRMAQEAGRMGAWEWDLRLQRVFWSEALEHLYGLPTGGFDQTFEMFATFVHPDDVALTEARVAQAMEDGIYENEHRIIRADTQEVRWIAARGEVIRDDRGTPVRLVGINIDITERKAVEQERTAALEAEQAARTEAEAARERLTFLVDATTALSVSLDYAETLQTVTRLAVPAIGDLCIVDLVDNERLRSVAVAHSDPVAEELVWELRRAHPDVSQTSPTQTALRTGQTLVIENMTDEMLVGMAVDDDHLAKLRQLDLDSAVIVPLIARGRVIGLLALARRRGRAGFRSGDDAAVLTEVGRRVALAIDNARLFAEVTRTGERFRRMAETLQESLLPPTLPSVPGADLAATYRPAAVGATVGGDFYDVFPRADGAWGVVIGDVQGKGTEAASLTALARHALRTAAIRSDPEGALHVLNEMLVASEAHQDRFCTVLYGELRPAAPGMSVTFASGGHPPALLRRASTGAVEAVGGAGTLMGVLDEPTILTQDVALHPGDVLLLYTDGVTEARGTAGEFGEDRLAAVVAETVGHSAQTYIDAVEDAVTRFSEGRLRDDLAIVAIRAEAS